MLEEGIVFVMELEFLEVVLLADAGAGLASGRVEVVLVVLEDKDHELEEDVAHQHGVEMGVFCLPGFEQREVIWVLEVVANINRVINRENRESAHDLLPQIPLQGDVSAVLANDLDAIFIKKDEHPILDFLAHPADQLGRHSTDHCHRGLRQHQALLRKERNDEMEPSEGVDE